VQIDDFVAGLEGIAPTRLAGAWDNVGLLLEGTRPIRTVGVAIDLTGVVADELLDAGCDAIVSYHPPIFGGVKRLVQRDPRSRTLLRLVREGVHVYAPHSALDAARGGMAEWLLEPFGDVHDVAPIAPDALVPELGAGRLATLTAPRTLGELAPFVREHLGLSHVRLAGADDTLVRTVAVCPGAGGSLFQGVSADLLLTGEMRHHDVLAQVERGGAVLLTDHTNTERGFLGRYAERVRSVCGVEVVVSQEDADPLRVVG